MPFRNKPRGPGRGGLCRTKLAWLVLTVGDRWVRPLADELVPVRERYLVNAHEVRAVARGIAFDGHLVAGLDRRLAPAAPPQDVRRVRLHLPRLILSVRERDEAVRIAE